MTDVLYVNGDWWMSSNQHIGQTKIGILGKTQGLGSSSENMYWFVQGVYIE